MLCIWVSSQVWGNDKITHIQHAKHLNVAIWCVWITLENCSLHSCWLSCVFVISYSFPAIWIPNVTKMFVSLFVFRIHAISISSIQIQIVNWTAVVNQFGRFHMVNLFRDFCIKSSNRSLDQTNCKKIN